MSVSDDNKITAFKVHGGYRVAENKRNFGNTGYFVDVPADHVPKSDHTPSWFAQNCQFRTTDSRFWLWLGIDQAYHMLSNVFVAWLLAVWL